jgi:hypothetical protein
MTVTYFEDAHSVVPNRLHRSENRVDPFWAGLWGDSSQVSWESRRLAERRAKAGISRMTFRDKRDTPEIAVEAFKSTDEDARKALGALMMWRTGTSDQLAAFGGWDSKMYQPGGRRAEVPLPLRHLWSGHLAERGRFSINAAGVPMVWRMTRDRSIPSILSELPFTEWLKVTGGINPTAGPRHDRHNILSVELGLRIAEFCNPAAVFGEGMAAHHLLDVTGTHPVTTSGAGDLMMIRGDGLRIVFEITTSTRQTRARAKLDKWLEILSHAEYDESGTIIVFVDAGDPDARDSEVMNPLTKGILDALNPRINARRLRLRERVAVVRWKDWFPELGGFSDDFLKMKAIRPTGEGDNLWEPVSLSDPSSVTFAPSDYEPFTSAIGNSSLLYGVPYWLRDVAPIFSTPPDLDRWMFGPTPFERTYTKFGQG